MFLNHEVAEAAISRVFDVRREEISKWFESKKVGSDIRIKVKEPLGQRQMIGSVFKRGGTGFADGRTVMVRLIKVSDTEFRILTAFVAE